MELSNFIYTDLLASSTLALFPLFSTSSLFNSKLTPSPKVPNNDNNTSSSIKSSTSPSAFHPYASAPNKGSSKAAIRIFPIIVVVVNLTTRGLVGVYQSQAEFLAASASIFGFALSPRSFNAVLLDDRGIIHTKDTTFLVSYIDPNELTRASAATQSSNSNNTNEISPLTSSPLRKDDAETHYKRK